LSPIPQRFAIPTNDDDFEKLCRDILRLHWSCPGLEIFGKRGERQFGIDLLDLSGKDPLYAAQCKLKEEHKNLPPADIEAEVNEAKLFTPWTRGNQFVSFQNQVILAARIRNMCESRAMLLTIEEVATPLKLPSSGVGVIMSSSSTTLRHRRIPTFPADIFRFFCLSIDRGSFAGCTSTSPGERTMHGKRGMKDTDHFLTGVPFTFAVNGSIEEH
jgi:hypothetical protein